MWGKKKVFGLVEIFINGKNNMGPIKVSPNCLEEENGENIGDNLKNKLSQQSIIKYKKLI